MKRIITVSMGLILSVCVFAQTSEQLKMLQKLSPDQIEQLKKVNFDQNIKKTNTTSNDNKITINSDRTLDPYRDEIVIEEYENKTIWDSLKKIKKIKEFEKLDRENLIYGHEIFSKQNLTFAPSMNLPTPENYVLGSGDELNINIWGAAEADYKVLVSPDGYVNIEGVGLIQVRGMTIKQADNRIKVQLAKKYEGVFDGAVNVNISLGKIRTIKVNVAGEAKVPGTYSLPSLATLFNALYVAGGVSEIGSVREINLYRGGKKINTLDVYKYLLNGEIDVNVRLEDNDLIIVEPYINVVKMSGSIKRPMKYEMKSNENVDHLLKYSGGFNGEAMRNNITVSRSADGKQLQLFTVDKAGYNYFILMDHDSVFVSKVVQRYSNKLSVSGEVWQKGDYELKPGISTVKELVTQAGGLTPKAFLGRAILYRLNDDGDREIMGLNLHDVLNGGDDISLRPNDSLAVYAADFFNQEKTVIVYGEVNNPDTIVYGAGMTLKDAIVACGGFNLSASRAKIEISRRVTDPDAEQTPDQVAEIFNFKVTKDLSMTENSEQFLLLPFDEVFVRRSPGYLSQMNVVLEGEVVFEGQYTLHSRVTTLIDVIQRAGGLTKDAYAKGAYLRRQKTEFDLERERSLVKLRETFNPKDTLILSSEGIGEYYSVAIDLLAALKDPRSSYNLELKTGDKIVVPTYNNTVKISGAVYYPNTVGYVPGLKTRNYIESAGGYSDRARKKPFIVYQNGMVVKRGKMVDPGSEIVVPFKPFKEPMDAASWIGIASSVVSMAAMVTSLIR